ncbi:hypothetical protein BDY21DRAFT_343766 [Lineolata rhizophorae]|uniref:DNA-directed RNA polymerase subunit beta n=1 Tax=Lineolata rhizophorae TaxID=578093 RepID=A0A6A6P091_9PEZI|nr:hypothetical protein BDY21DRAFT_343766 [Lineolata rhizophorae]
MLRSNRCHLEGMAPAQLVAAKEESEELGGYFVVNGIEKLIRMLLVARRNFPLAISRPSFQKRGPSYSTFGIQIRSARPDQTTQTNVLHYLNDGNVTLRFSWRKQEFLVPVMMVLKALVETNDREIFEGIVGAAGSKGFEERQFVIDRVELLLRTYKAYELYGREKTRAYLGKRFKIALQLHEETPDEEAGTEFLRKIVLPHLGSSNVTEAQDTDKFRMLLFMIRKLYSLAEGECSVDNPDAVSTQEILLPGFLYGMLLKERLEEYLNNIRGALSEWSRNNNWQPFTGEQFRKEFESKILRRMNENIGQALEYFLSTGNLTSPTGLDLQQVSGFTVVAEKLNFLRFISHFRMVHRGAFFAEMKTTTVRKLLPESWGFLCPVHTPDGSPCGLLNHFAHKCKIATRGVDVSTIPRLVSQLGLTNTTAVSLSESVVVQLDGRVLGFCSPKQAKIIADTLRFWKVEGTHGVPRELEIGYIPNSDRGQYPGIYMSSTPARMFRPVNYLLLDELDFVGPLEQPHMSIACVEEEITPKEHTHVEFDPTHILSILANMTPFSDFNQSPRNMYQCQMGKQSMGTPGTAIRYRTDNKTYRLQTGQTPIVRPPLHNEYGFDNFPNGMNAVVAVISYTGYDMDDAMIVNKHAHERGFAHGTIYKTKKIDLDESNRRAKTSRTITKLFGFAPGGLVRSQWREKLDDDGLPHIGSFIRQGDIIAASHSVTYNPVSRIYENRDGETQLHRYTEHEDAFVEEVRVLGAESGAEPCQAVSIKFRVPRSPVIGDKFSSRHGQKGVCSQKFPAIDMPFSESGMQPDVIINPHAFPSRMTIGMFVESLAGKAGALHGLAQDSTPFRFDEEHTAVNYFGEQLRRAGYNYYGNEPMYSGMTGEELHADIYIGLVYYQRLRHMVNDKFQVRTTGPVSALHGQPIKGRKRGGGIRVGEMERDALIAHGAAFLLQDRLMNCSDHTLAYVCRRCGSFLSVTSVVEGYSKARHGAVSGVKCRCCAKRVDTEENVLVASKRRARAQAEREKDNGNGEGSATAAAAAATEKEGWLPKSEIWEDGAGNRFTGGNDVTVVAVPGVLRYLDIELASMGIKLKFNVEP